MQLSRVAHAAPAGARPQGHDGPGAGKDGHVVQPAVDRVPGIAAVVPAAEEVIPVARRQPDDGPRQAGVDVGRANERGDDEVAEEVLVGAGVGLFAVGVVVVHRPHRRHRFRLVQSRQRIEVRDERVAQLHGGARHTLHLGVVGPRSPLVERVLGAVQPEDRAEDAKLNPADEQLPVLDAAHVAADVVAPPTIGDVGRRSRHVGLEGQRRPGDDRITGKADGVAVVAQPAPAREDERPLALAGQVVEVQVIEPPQRVQPGHARVRALLPVHPPEVDAHPFQGVVQHLEISVGEARVGDVERDRLPGADVKLQPAAHLAVGGLVRADAQRRVKVQRRPQPLLVQPGDEARRIGEEIGIPGVARPPADALAHVDQMPVHVDDADRQRHVVVAELGHQRPQVSVAVGPVAAPPVAQRPARQQRRAAGESGVVAQGGAVVGAVARAVAHEV